MKDGRLWMVIGVLGVLLALGGGAWIFTSVHQSFEDSALYQTALSRARTDQRVIDALGEPIEPGWFVSGSLSTSNGHQSGEMTISVSGPRGEGEIYLEGSGRATAHYQVLRVDVDGGAAINLLDGKGKIVARSDQDCERSTLCSKEGKCKNSGGSCVPGKYEHCADSEKCRSHGACGYHKQAGCVPLTHEHCASSEVCRKEAKCQLVGALCLRMHPEECRQSRECRREGHCTMKGDDRCVAAADSDCARSIACLRDGRCVAKDGACVDGKAAAGTGEGDVAIRKLSVSGRLPKQVVARVMQPARRNAVACYRAALKKKKDLRGTVTIRFVIGRDGSTSNVAGGGTMPDGEVFGCTTRGFHELRFPKPEGGIVTVSAKLIMKP